MSAFTPRAATSLAPRTFDEALRFSELLATTNLVPAAYRGKPTDILVAVQMGAELGLAPMQAVQNIAVINGKPSVYGDALLALARGSAVCDDVVETIEGEGDAMTAVCVATRVGKRPVTSRFSVADAKRAGLWGKQGPWQQYPKRMLQMRARGFALRDAFPDVLRGVITAEEAQDIPEPREVPNLASHANEGMRIAKEDMIAARQAFRVLFPNGKDKLYSSQEQAWDAVTLAAERCGDLEQARKLEQDNAALLSYRPGDERPLELEAAWIAIEAASNRLPPADPLETVAVEPVSNPDELPPAEPEPPAPLESSIEVAMGSDNIGASVAAKIADHAARLRDAADYGAALRIMDEEGVQKMMAWLTKKPAPATLAALEAITRSKVEAEVAS